jgi:hypothetical protein
MLVAVLAVDVVQVVADKEVDVVPVLHARVSAELVVVMVLVVDAQVRVLVLCLSVRVRVPVPARMRVSVRVPMPVSVRLRRALPRGGRGRDGRERKDGRG